MAARLFVPMLALAFLAAFVVSTRDLGFEARIFPLSIGAVTLLVVLSLVFQEVREWRVAAHMAPKDIPADLPSPDLWQSVRPGFLSVVLTGGFIYATGHVGFFVALPIFLLAILLVLGVRPWWAALIAAALYAAGLFALFDSLMGLRLPTGG